MDDLYNEQFDLDLEIESINFFTKIQKTLPKKIRVLKDYAQKFKDNQLNTYILNIENIINGYTTKKDLD